MITLLFIQGLGQWICKTNSSDPFVQSERFQRNYCYLEHYKQIIGQQKNFIQNLIQGRWVVIDKKPFNIFIVKRWKSSLCLVFRGSIVKEIKCVQCIEKHLTNEYKIRKLHFLNGFIIAITIPETTEKNTT